MGWACHSRRFRRCRRTIARIGWPAYAAPCRPQVPIWRSIRWQTSSRRSSTISPPIPERGGRTIVVALGLAHLAHLALWLVAIALIVAGLAASVVPGMPGVLILYG